MKSLIINLSLVILPVIIFGQDHKTTLNNDGSFEMLIISDLPDKTAKQLYQGTIDWIAYTFRNSESVTQSQVENKMVRINGVSSGVINGSLGYKYGLGYSIQIDIKDNKIRFRGYDLQIIGVDAARTRSNIEPSLLKSNGDLRTGKASKKIKSDTDMELSRIYKSLIDSFSKNIESNNDW